jgi:hypothetical protein
MSRKKASAPSTPFLSPVLDPALDALLHDIEDERESIIGIIVLREIENRGKKKDEITFATYWRPHDGFEVRIKWLTCLAKKASILAQEYLLFPSTAVRAWGRYIEEHPKWKPN